MGHVHYTVSPLREILVDLKFFMLIGHVTGLVIFSLVSLHLVINRLHVAQIMVIVTHEYLDVAIFEFLERFFFTLG
jgi:hypothetical protein